MAGNRDKATDQMKLWKESRGSQVRVCCVVVIVYSIVHSVSAVQLKMTKGGEMGERSDKVIKQDPDQS